MRTIKFRIWNGKDGYCTEDFVKANLFNTIDSHPEYVQQFTGLLDKFGKEIYEGDIVNSSGDRNMQVSIGGYWETVGGNGHGVHIHNQEETRVFGVSPFNQDNALEIIGNIWENPELLK